MNRNLANIYIFEFWLFISPPKSLNLQPNNFKIVALPIAKVLAPKNLKNRLADHHPSNGLMGFSLLCSTFWQVLLTSFPFSCLFRCGSLADLAKKKKEIGISLTQMDERDR